ncbi:MAG: hypothetical protein LUI87_02230 [Lachnospiraceae bacterium]|nr:hypothetical protein [Lachnospiraceae bacterium]
MNSYALEFPRGVQVDVFNPPEDFEEQIRKSFAGYTEGTNKDYTYQDKLAYIDLMRIYAHGEPDGEETAEEYITERFEYELHENGTFLKESDFRTTEVLSDMWERGHLDLHASFTGDHHIDERIQQLLVRAIKVVINYEGGSGE